MQAPRADSSPVRASACKDVAELLESAAKAVFLTGKLPAEVSGTERDFYKGACSGTFDLDHTLTNGRCVAAADTSCDVSGRTLNT